VDGLWKVASRLHGCMVVRDSRALQWKTRDHWVLGIERGDELVGLVASRPRMGRPEVLVRDLLAADGAESLRATLVAVTNLAHARAVAESRNRRLDKVAIAATPILEPVLRDLGFARAGYELPLVIHAFDSMIPGEAVAPARWYESL
jgi:hypothetical protein